MPPTDQNKPRSPKIKQVRQTSIKTVHCQSEEISRLPEFENLLPSLLILGPLFYLGGPDKIALLWAGFFHRFNRWVGGSPSPLSVCFLPFLTSGPTGK